MGYCHGIKGDFFILQTYGYEHILTLNNLEKAGLLKAQTGGRNNYPTIRKTLRLWMDDVNEQVNINSRIMCSRKTLFFKI